MDLLRFALIGLVCALSSAASAPRGQGAPVPVARPAIDVETAFAELDREFIVRWSRYQDGLERVRKGELAASAAPVPPQGEFYPRYEALAAVGHARALRWCIQFASASGGSVDDVHARKVGFFLALIDRFVTEDWFPDVLRDLRNEATAGGLKIDEAVALCLAAAEQTKNPAIRAQALLEAATIFAADSAASSTSEAERLLAEIIERHPETSAAGRAKQKLFQVRNLRVGVVAPDFTTQDVDGVSFKLSDYRGKVVVLDFWGFW